MANAGKSERLRRAGIGRVLNQARRAAVRYDQLTQRPLGITGEYGEYEAARTLNLKLAVARQSGFDAVGSSGKKYQIESRCKSSKEPRRSGRLSSIRLDRDWDSVLLVLMDDRFTLLELVEAGRPAIEKELKKPGRSNQRGALAVGKFKRIGRRLWPKA